MATPKELGYNFISDRSYLQNDFVPNVATFNVSPNMNTGIMSQYPQYPILPQEGGEGGGGPIGPGRADPNFDYEFDALGGLNNPNNVGLTEEEQALMDQMRFGKALTPMQLVGIGINPIGGGIRAIIKNRRQKKDAERELSELSGEAFNARVDNITRGYGGSDDSAGATGPTAGGAGMGVGGGHAADYQGETTSSSTSNDSPAYDYAYGGRAGYSGEGLSKYEIFKLGELGYNTKGGTVLEPFGGINVLRDILRVNKYAYGGIVGLYR